MSQEKRIARVSPPPGAVAFLLNECGVGGWWGPGDPRLTLKPASPSYSAFLDRINVHAESIKLDPIVDVMPEDVTRQRMEAEVAKLGLKFPYTFGDR